LVASGMEIAMPLPGFEPVDPSRLSRISQIKGWFRDAFSVSPNAHILVVELQCREEGCPPIETVITVLDDPCCAGKYKVHKTLKEVEWKDIGALASGEKGHAGEGHGSNEN